MEIPPTSGHRFIVGEFAGDGVVLDFDYGSIQTPLADDNEPTYVVTHETIGGYKARIVRPSVAGHGITGIYFPEIASGNKLCLHGQISPIHNGNWR